MLFPADFFGGFLFVWLVVFWFSDFVFCGVFGSEPGDLLNITLKLSFRFEQNRQMYSHIRMRVKVLSFPLGDSFNAIQQRL